MTLEIVIKDDIRGGGGEKIKIKRTTPKSLSLVFMCNLVQICT